ncbi:hypothetical protein [Kitasatospora sp. NPDC127116]|uniref:hypothetical protein n=1 Tax=Kitasatospora sp. NPDC127116 TaxID=3345367 RepID=UPI003636E3EE
MPETAIPPTRAQLHERACIHCGSEDGELVPSGHYPMTTRRGFAPLGWAVVAHPTCTEERLMDPHETIDPQELQRIEASFDELRAHISSTRPASEAPEAEQRAPMCPHRPH